MKTQEYNGWTNYETWLVKLWIDNKEGSHLYWREQAEFLLSAEGQSAHRPRFGNFTKDEIAKLALAEQLKEQHEETIHCALPKNMHASFIMDLINASMSEVDWHSIAESLLETARESIGA